MSPRCNIPKAERLMGGRNRNENEKNNIITDEYKQLLMSIPHLRQKEEEAQKKIVMDVHHVHQPIASKITRAEILEGAINYIGDMKTRNAIRRKTSKL